MTPRRTRKKELERDIDRAYAAVFADDLDRAPFTNEVPCRAVLYPVTNCLDREAFERILDAAHVVGDSHLYVVPFGEDSATYEVATYEEYATHAALVERVIFGLSGTWGLMVYEDCAAVGGPPEFVERLRATLPALDLQVYEYIRHQKETAGGWHAGLVKSLDVFLAHLYGAERARALLDEFGVPRPHRVTAAELRGEVGRAMRSVFSSTDPYGAPFTDRVQCRAILYPIGYDLVREEFEPLLEAARLVGDTHIYVALLEERGNPHYEVSSFDDYETIAFPSQNAIFGLSGTWGLTISDEDHGVIGGSAEFLDHLREVLPPAEPFHKEDEAWEPVPFDLQVYEFLRDWKKWVDKGHVYPWLPELLTHVYGVGRAQELLVEAGLT